MTAAEGSPAAGLPEDGRYLEPPEVIGFSFITFGGLISVDGWPEKTGGGTV